ncbi:unnamed protein product [Bemisia tabaci]|uniref:Glycoprotein n=1 Tax=Bemisia tabaci TaxID=7038 RepID=A0A9P0ALI0_BEMTA|nr:unnamed protein product [Bemisia tabaci]
MVYLKQNTFMMMKGFFLLGLLLIGRTSTIFANSPLPTHLHRLSVPTVPKLTVIRESYNATLSVAPESLEGIIGRRLKFSTFCKQACLTGCNHCEKKRVGLPPSLVELLDWHKKKYCTIVFVNSGIRQLKEDKDCHASCFGDTCIQDFACSIGSDRYPVHLFSTDDSVQAKIIIGNDNTYIINSTAHKFHISLDSASTLAFIPEPKFEIKRYNISVRCYKKLDTAPLCQLPEDPDFPDLANTIISLNEGKDAGSVRNVHLKVHQLIPDIPDDEMVYLLDSDSSVKSIKRRRRYASQRIPDPKSLRNALIYLARESAFNDFRIIKSLSDVQNAFLQLLKSVSYRNPEVLGRVIGHNKQTSWFSENLFFFQGQNFKTAADSNSNCNDQEQIFKDGAFVEKMNDDICYKGADVSHDIENVNLFEDSSIVFSDVRIQKVAARPDENFEYPKLKLDWYEESPWYTEKTESEGTSKIKPNIVRTFLIETGPTIAWILLLAELIKCFIKFTKQTCLLCLLLLLLGFSFSGIVGFLHFFL